MYLVNTYNKDGIDNELRTVLEYEFEDYDTLELFIEFVLTFGKNIGINIREE